MGICINGVSRFIDMFPCWNDEVQMYFALNQIEKLSALSDN